MWMKPILTVARYDPAALQLDASRSKNIHVCSVWEHESRVRHRALPLYRPLLDVVGCFRDGPRLQIWKENCDDFFICGGV